MKNLIFSFSIFICVSYIAQTSPYVAIKNVLKKTHPEITTDDKILAVNIWEVNDPNSRACNKSFDKVYYTYESAKLKGGLKGLIVIAINKDNLSSIATISFSKDGNEKLISLRLDEVRLDSLQQGARNFVFDSAGSEIYKNLPASEILISINKLIIR